MFPLAENICIAMGPRPGRNYSLLETERRRPSSAGESIAFHLSDFTTSTTPPPLPERNSRSISSSRNHRQSDLLTATPDLPVVGSRSLIAQRLQEEDLEGTIVEEGEGEADEASAGQADQRTKVRRESSGVQGAAAAGAAEEQREGARSSRQRPKSTRFQLYNVSLISAASPSAMRAPPPIQKRKVMRPDRMDQFLKAVLHLEHDVLHVAVRPCWPQI